MERLTERSKTGTAFFDDDGALIRGAGGAFHQKKDMTANFIHQRFVALDKTIDRLAAYEDTGLEPEEVTELMAAHGTAILELSEYRSIGPAKHFLELAQAEKDGRLVVLPCKVGDTVCRVITPRDTAPVITEIEIKTLGQAADLIGRIGKKQLLVSWYLTREEAETALKKREETI